MDQIWKIQILGFFIASFSQLFLFLLSYHVSKKYWVFAYCTGILLCSAILSTKSLWQLPYLAHAILLGFLIFFLHALKDSELKKNFKNFFVSGLFFFKNLRSRENKIFSPTNLLLVSCCIFIFIDLLYAAYPAYRPDQWDYHLNLAKLVSKFTLKEIPLYNDHVFFTGNYEYFYLLFRVFFNDDILMQSITNTMSIQMFLIVVFGLIKSVFCQTKSLLTSLFTSGFILFSMPSHNMIINAKVEPLLLGIACCVLAILYLLQTNNQRALSFFLSFFLVAPLSCKIIWIHFMISFSVLFLFSVRKIRSNLNVRYLLLGTLVGVFTCLPFLIKNYYFFDNPVHPVQFSFLRSDRWTTMMQEYWSDISKKAGNLQEYFLILLKVPFNYMWSIKYFLIGCLLWFQVKDKKGFLQKEGAMLNRILLMLGVAFLLWPIFYNADVFPRFYFPLIALAIIPFVLLYKHSHQSKWFFVILVIPFLFSSSMEVKLSGMKRNMGNTIDDFYDAMPSPMGERNGENVINIHRKSLSKNFSLSEKAVLADTPVAYFLDGMLLYLEGLDYGFYRETMAQENPKSKKCVWIFLKQFNINYLYAARTNFSNWPSEYEDVIGQAELVNKEGSIRYVSDSLINAAINNCSD